MTSETLAFRIIIEKAVAGIAYGIQKGSGNSYETLQKQVSNSDDLVFDIALPVKRNKEGDLVLHGPFVHGPLHGRFLYLDLGSYAGQENAPVNGRIKVPLPNVLEEFISEAADRGLLVARIPGTNKKDGRPTMATVKPFDGWKVEER